MKNFSIEQFLSLDNYTTDARLSRRKGSGGSQEFFTPYSIVKRMADKISDEDWANPEKTFLEPAAGNGQFVCYIVYRRIISGVDPVTVFKTLYATELMQDNVDEMKARCLDLLDEMEVTYDKDEIISIMDHNFVCTDFFNWDYINWKPEKKALF